MDKYLSNNDYSYILGISLTIEALNKIGGNIEKVYISSKAIKNAQYEKLVNLCNKNKVPLIEDDSVIDKLSIKENCYGIGVFKKFYNELTSDKHIVLYRFSDYGELGTIMRSAVSFNFKDIVLIDSNIDYFDPKTIRASMGSIFHLNIKEYSSFTEYLKDYNFNLYPFVSNGSHELKDIELKMPYSLIIPQDYYALDEIFNDGYYLKHQGFKEVSLSSLSSIVFNYCFEKRKR